MDPALFLRTAKDSMEPMRARHPFQTLAAALAPSVSRCLPPAAAIAAALTALFSRPAGAPAPPPKHGLTGAYYVSTLETHGDVNPSGKDWFVQVWMDPNDFQLPRPFTAPAAVRVDPQIAFGQGKGFVSQNGKQTQWWPTGFAIPAGWTTWQATMKPWDWVTAVIWKGYLHLPKAGTYYLATASRGPSAVYLNQARVALNGPPAGGVLVSDVFTYAKEDLRDYLQNLAYGREDLLFRAQPGDNYVVPVTVETPRDVAIEVRYNSWRSESSGRGIDLFWVTPDSPHDASGKPVAHIVPSDVLYTEPPGPVEQPTVHGANSMLSADFLYFPAERTDKEVTVTIRLADKDGSPITGKRVHVGSLVSYGARDSIKQPDKPTDENGETTARIRPGEGYKVTHDSRIFATNVTDLVDVAQVTWVTFQAGTVPTSFFASDAFSPYYAPAVLRVEPLPLIVGRPVTVSVALENRGKFPVDLTATFRANDWAIGPAFTTEIGRVEHIQLKAGEARRASVNWTPGKAEGHQCFEVQLTGSVSFAANRRGTGIAAAAFLPTTNLAYALPPAAKSIWERIQSNIGPVEPCTPPNVADPTIFGLPGNNVIISRYERWRFKPRDLSKTHRIDISQYQPEPGADTVTLHAGQDYTSRNEKGNPTKLPFTSPISGRVLCTHKKGDTKCLNDGYNTVGVVSCDSAYTLQFLHASRIDVHDGQVVTRGTQLGVTGETGAKGAGVHLHVQEWKNRVMRNCLPDPGSREALVDPNAEGPLVNAPACDPWPCPQIGPRPGPPAFYQDRGTISEDRVPKSGGLKRQAADLGKRMEDDSRRHIDESSLCIQDPSLCGTIRGGDWLPVRASAERWRKDPPDPTHQRLAVAASDSVVGYMDAVTVSMERYQGAIAAGDRDWAARHYTAMQLYLRRLAESLRREADVLQRNAGQLPPDSVTGEGRLEQERQQLLERLRRTGPTPDDLKALGAAGIPQGIVQEIMNRVLSYPQESLAGKVVSPDEGYADLTPLPVRSARALLLSRAAEERKWADEVDRIAALRPGDGAAGAFSQTFKVGNPHEREETVDLFLRPISIPPDWKLFVANANQTLGGTEPAGPRVQEAEAGKHYAVRLPAKGQIKVASVLVPVGEVGAHTTARWAVESKTGDELIGGMVLEMNVPYKVGDLKLPPVGSKEVEDELPTPSKTWARTVAEAATGILVVGVLVFLLISWRRRRPRVAP